MGELLLPWLGTGTPQSWTILSPSASFIVGGVQVVCSFVFTCHSLPGTATWWQIRQHTGEATSSDLKAARFCS